jgi:hypothetical protein
MCETANLSTKGQHATSRPLKLLRVLVWCTVNHSYLTNVKGEIEYCDKDDSNRNDR